MSSTSGGSDGPGAPGSSGEMSPEDWFVLLARALADPDAEREAVDAATRAALLDLARIAAHTSERWAAPVSTWLAGLAFAGLDRGERSERLARLVVELEQGLADPERSA